MTEEEQVEYQRTQDTLVMLANMIVGARLDLTKFLQQIGQAEATGPIFDPTLWIKGHSKLESVKQLAQAAQKFEAEAKRQIVGVGG